MPGYWDALSQQHTTYQYVRNRLEKMEIHWNEGNTEEIL